MLRIDGTFLRSAVGRRIFTLFLFASTVPIVLMTVVAYQGISNLLNRQATAELAAYSRNYGMDLYARLRSAQAVFEQISEDGPEFGAKVGAAGAGHDAIFRSLALVGDQGAPMFLPGTPAVPKDLLASVLARATLERKLPGDDAIVEVPGATPLDTVLAMVRQRRGRGGAAGRVVAVLEPSYVFGDRENLPAQTDVCVLAGTDHLPLYCSDWNLLDLAQRSAARQTRADPTATQQMDLGGWTLFPTTNLKFAPWTFTSMRAVGRSALADRGIGRTYVEVGLACLALVALLSLIQIRRTLGPLERLMDATRRVAARDFSQPIRIDRQDEFGRLALSFNEMATTIADREKRLLDEARNDSLTGLPNRLRIHEIIEKMLAGGDRQAAPFALLFIDLDRFKGVNDGLGHDVGDALLAQAARRIHECVRTHDVVARLGGDEFIVLTTDITPEAKAGALAREIIKTLSSPYRIGPVEAHVSASIGVALWPKDGATREALIRNADTAMYRAKQEGRGRCVQFEEAMSRAAVEVLLLEKDLREALQRSEIGVHFQPRILLSDQSLVGAEALARWRHPTRGAVPPAEFISLAEEVGLIEALGESVLAQACSLLAERKRQGKAICPISVNVSSLQLRNPDVCQRFGRIVSAFGLEASDLEFEITESALVNDLQKSRATLQRLRSAGFRISLDDFGTGYSSLSYLQNLPIDVMKIDRSFVTDLDSSAGARAIAIAIIGMARSLGIRVVAEGVETNKQATMLLEWGCQEAQGYLYSRALPAEAFERYVETRLPDFVKAV